MKIEIGKVSPQKEGYSAFVPAKFPPAGIFDLDKKIIIKAAEAERLVGKLDGITHTLPDVGFYLSMFVSKDAEASAQIEGTRATMIDAIEKKAGISVRDTDADDILHYIKALNYGLRRINDFPLSLRFIRELHSELMTGARSTHFATPGEFRKSQNWIGGTTPQNAKFVPPTIDEMGRSLDDLEAFLHDRDSTIPLIQAGLAHAQFETIHPFLDGNGRTGRLLITLLLCGRGLLEKPVLFLSAYFRKHQKVYYDRLFGYQNNEVEPWLNFFLDGVIEIANGSIEVSRKIDVLRDVDISKIQMMAKRESVSGALVLKKLYAQPIVSTTNIMKWTGFTRAGSQKLIDRFVVLGILKIQDASEKYDRSYVYSKYLDIFINNAG